MTTLTNPTPGQLSEAVAVHVAGWKRITTMYLSYFDTNGVYCGEYATPQPIEAFASPQGMILLKAPDYARSADAVLPLLISAGEWNLFYDDKTGFEITLEDKPMIHPDGGKYFAIRKSLPEAAAIALLRAHGVEVVFTSDKGEAQSPAKKL